MQRKFFVICAGIAALLLAAPRTPAAQDSNAAYKLKVRVNYTGTGAVDAQHKIYVVVWDSPDFAKGGNAMPAAVESMSSKTGTVTFDNVQKTPAYVSTAYDPSGQWDAQSPPPEGSSLGLYSKTPGTPEPIELKAGKTTTIDLNFDDTVKMKGGQPAR